MASTGVARVGLLRDWMGSGVAAPLVGAVAGGAAGLLVSRHPAAPPGVEYWIGAGVAGGALGAVLDRGMEAAFGRTAGFGAALPACLAGGILGGIVGGGLDGSPWQLVYGALWGLLIGLGSCFALLIVQSLATRFLPHGFPGLVGAAGGAAAAWAAGTALPSGREEVLVPILRMAAGAAGGLCGALAGRFALGRGASDGTGAPRGRLLPPSCTALVLTGIATGTLLARSDLATQVAQRGRSESIDLSPDGTRAIVSRGALGDAKGPDFEHPRLLDLADGTVLCTMAERSDGLRFLPDGTRAAGAGRLWSLEDGAVAATMPPSEVETIGNTGFSTWNVPGKSDLDPVAASPLPGGRQVVVALDFDGTTDDAFLALWDLERNEVAARIHAHDGRTTALDVSPDGRHAVTAADDGSLAAWNVDADGFQVFARTGPAIRIPGGAGDRVSAAAISPDGRTVVGAADGIGNKDFAVRTWDARTGNETRRLLGHLGTVTAVRFLPDGRHVVSGSKDGTVRTWDVESGAEVRRRHARGPVAHLAVDASGTRLLVATETGALRLFGCD